VNCVGLASKDKTIFEAVMQGLCSPESMYKYCDDISLLDAVQCPQTRANVTDWKDLDDVECDRNGTVIGFLAHHMTLGGTVSTLVGLLSELREFHVARGNLRGSLPSEFNRLTKLTNLGFGTNRLSGTLPDLTALTDLRMLYFVTPKKYFFDF
jgi:Leucine-rich repeat (LRR) protein